MIKSPYGITFYGVLVPVLRQLFVQHPDGMLFHKENIMKNNVILLLIALVLVVFILMLLIPPASEAQVSVSTSISHVAITQNPVNDLFNWLMCWEGSEVCYAQ